MAKVWWFNTEYVKFLSANLKNRKSPIEFKNGIKQCFRKITPIHLSSRNSVYTNFDSITLVKETPDPTKKKSIFYLKMYFKKGQIGDNVDIDLGSLMKNGYCKVSQTQGDWNSISFYEFQPEKEEKVLHLFVDFAGLELRFDFTTVS